MIFSFDDFIFGFMAFIGLLIYPFLLAANVCIVLSLAACGMIVLSLPALLLGALELKAIVTTKR